MTRFSVKVYLYLRSGFSVGWFRSHLMYEHLFTCGTSSQNEFALKTQGNAVIGNEIIRQRKNRWHPSTAHIFTGNYHNNLKSSSVFLLNIWCYLELLEAWITRAICHYGIITWGVRLKWIITIRVQAKLMTSKHQWQRWHELARSMFCNGSTS